MNTWYEAQLRGASRMNDLIHEARTLATVRMARTVPGGARRWSRVKKGRVALERAEVAAFRPVRENTIVCVEGRVWVTQLGDPHDYVLGPGERVTTSGKGRVVIQALHPSTVSVRRATPAGRAAALRPAVRTA